MCAAARSARLRSTGRHRRPEGQDNLVVDIDTVIHFQVTDARAATYEVAGYIQAVEQLTVTALRNIVGGMSPDPHRLPGRHAWLPRP
ncbi:band 7 protein [Actinobacteria bacterium OV450]|nr:band 7 protein [Actinobacteria bacterium OV450]